MSTGASSVEPVPTLQLTRKRIRNGKIRLEKTNFISSKKSVQIAVDQINRFLSDTESG